MKLKLCFLALLCLFFRASAQELKIKTYAENITKGGISIGGKVPDIHLSGIRNLKLNGKPVTELNLSAFSGKLLILDFWATWCAPCRTMVPVMDSLQRVFGDQVVFLPVTYQKEAVVAPVLAAMQKYKPFNLPEVTGDVTLHKLFPHRTLPHYVWINGDGTVVAITEYTEVNAANIMAMLNGGAPSLTEKKDLKVPFSDDKPLFINGNGGDGSAVLYHRVFSGYVPGLPPALHISEPEPGKAQSFSVRNLPFIWFCRLAFKENGRWFPKANIKVLAKDTTLANPQPKPGQTTDAWLADGNGFSYELLAPPGVGDKAFGMIQEDLHGLFPQWQVTIEPVKTRCLALVRTDSLDRLKTKGGTLVTNISPFACELQNAHLAQLMMRLQVQYLQRSPLPVVDQSGYTGRVDLKFTGKLSDTASINTGLAPYGLALAEREGVVDMMVIRDAPVNPQKP
jgi:thiol-disulfide isomerase/thioredoxin